MSTLQQPASFWQVVMCSTSAHTCRLSSRLHARRKDSPILSPLIPIGEDGQVCLLSHCHSLGRSHVSFLEHDVHYTPCCLAV